MSIFPKKNLIGWFWQAPRRMTEPNEEEIEPLVIEPRPELMEVSSSGGEENKPTTICLICGHVLFKKVSTNLLISQQRLP